MKKEETKNPTKKDGMNTTSQDQLDDMNEAIKVALELIEKQGFISGKYPDALKRTVISLSREALNTDPFIPAKDLLIKVISQLSDKLPMKLLADSAIQIKEEWESFQIAKGKAA